MVKTARRATQDDVARLAKVSTAVVSYVVNHGPRPVADATRERVLRAIHDLDYRPNAAARALKLARTDVLGLIVPDISNPFFSEFAKHVQGFAARDGFALMIGSTDLDPDREAAQFGSVLEREVDGLIVFGIRDVSTLSAVVASGIPLVSMDWQLQDAAVPTIVADDYGAAKAGVDHLLGHGHTEIAYIGGPSDLLVSNARRAAWVDLIGPTLPAARLHQLETSADFSRRGGYLAARELLDGFTERPSALFVSSDIQAIGALRACRELDVAIPTELAVVSFDGTLDSEYSAPPLTVVQLPLALMAERAVKKVLDPEEAGLDLHSTVPHRIIIRESCGCEPSTQTRADDRPETTTNVR